MATLHQTPIAVTSSADVTISASTFARYVEIQEDGAGAAAGLKVTWPNGAVSEYTPSMQPICIGNKGGALGGGHQPLAGVPTNYNGNGGAATTYCTIRSLGANTQVRVTEWN